MNIVDAMADKVNRMELLRKMDMWIEELEAMRLGMIEVNKQLTQVFTPENESLGEELSLCCDAIITETGFCSDCKDGVR
jgi:hypothetical protein